MIPTPRSAEPVSPETDTEENLRRRLRSLSAALGLVLAAVGGLVLVGWCLRIALLTTVMPGLASMKPNTAVGFISGGLSLALAQRASPQARAYGRAAAALTALIGLATLLEYGLSWDAGIDQALFIDPLASAFPGRMSVVSAVEFSLLACALLALDARPRNVRLQPSEWLALLAFALSWVAALGYLYGAEVLYAFAPFSSIALHTTVAFVLFALAVLIGRPELGLVVPRITDRGPGGVLSRRLLPAALIVPVVFGWLRLRGQQLGWYGTEVGLAIFATSNVFCFCVLIWLTAGVLKRLDARRSAAELRLRANEVNLATTLHSIGDAVIATDEQGRIVRMNAVAEQLTGYALSEARGEPLGRVFSIINQFTRAKVQDPVAIVLRDQKVVELANHTLLIARDGKEIAIADSGAPIRDSDGVVHGVVLVFRDVTERERAQREQRRSDELMRTGFAAARMMAWETDLATGVLRVSDNSRALLGLLPSSPFDRLEHGLTIICPQDRDLVEHGLTQAAREGTATDRRFRIIREDSGATAWFEWRSVARVGASGSQLVGGVLLDVDEAVHREEALRESEARYRTHFESAPEAILTYDVDRRVCVEVNQNAEQLFGYDRSALASLPGSVLSPPVQPDGAVSAQVGGAYVERALAGEHPVFEWTYLHRAGHEIPCEVRMVRQPGQGNLCRVSVVDISARKRAELAQRGLEEALHATEMQLRQAQKMEAIGRLAGGVAHDFNNMLFVILGYTALALEGLPPADAQFEHLEQIMRASERAAKLTAQLLAFSRQQVLSARVMNLNTTLEELGGMLRRLIGEDVVLSLRLEAKRHVCVDPSQLEQVVMNLAVNARDAMPTGGTLMIETMDVDLGESYARQHLEVAPGPYVMLAVSDTGCGMDAATRERIFEPFFTTKGVGKGTGLGLSTVFGIVKQSGGQVWVYSEPDKGTTFKVYLPASDAGSPTALDTQGSSPFIRGSETVLLVEDDASVRALARVIISKHGYNVLEASTPGDALLMSERFSGAIDLLLTDVIMPHMNGRELAERVAQLRPTIKVLFMSGYTDDVVVHRGVLKAGMDFVQKPLLPEALLAKIRQVLDGGRSA